MGTVGFLLVLLFVWLLNNNASCLMSPRNWQAGRLQAFMIVFKLWHTDIELFKPVNLGPPHPLNPGP